MARALSSSFLLLAAGSLAACFAGAGPEGGDAEESEDELRFRAGVVDTTLPEVDAVGYDIELAVTDAPGRETFRAAVKGSYVATEDLTELSLDFAGNTIDDVTVSGRRAEHRREGDRLVVKLPQRVAKGRRFTTRVAYHGQVTQADGADPNDFAAFGGFMVKQKNSENKRIYTSLSWPSKARRWLPLRDHPRDVAEVAFTVTWPKSFTVLANGKRVGTTDNPDGSKTWRYEALTPMPTYDFHVSAYESWKQGESRSESNVPIATYAYARTASRASSVYGDVPKVLDFYEAKFGKYRWGSLAFIEEPIFGGGMEHASVVSMDETLFPDPREARSTAFHELAHHWSGNLVHVRTWNDFWLSEGFTEYLTARAIAHVDGPAAGKRVYREYLTSTLAADRANPHALAPAGAEIDVLSIFDAIPYQKGALTVRMLERIVGEPEMTAFIKGWFDRHGFGKGVTTDDLQRELEEASGKDLSGFFATFVRGGYHPELRVTFAPAGGETELRVEQLQSQGPAGGFLFPLDLDLVDDAGRAERVTVELTGKTTTKRVRTARAPRSVVVDPDEYAIAVTACGQSGGGECKADYRCAPQRAGVSACVPR
ncbi:MAG: M1 family metallopeptidase [Labilithrix sp.]|nr:M1 family metallopeptidase [Labilithrix sp.]